MMTPDERQQTMDMIARHTLTTPNGIVFREWDKIRITGFSYTTNRRMVNFVGTVGCAFAADPVNFKLWPDDDPTTDGQLTDAERWDGKIWFYVTDIESCEILYRGDYWEMHVELGGTG